jgi:hypothetical protein
VKKIPRWIQEWLDNTQGLIEPDEGRRLASLAGEVPKDRAIVEIGSHTGLSTCWLAAGSRYGYGAHITAVDPWPPPRPDSQDDPWNLGPDGVIQRFQMNVAGTTQDLIGGDFRDLITPLRMESHNASKVWLNEIGLLFIDAIHEEWAVLQDYGSWERFIPSGGFLALHDYGDTYPGCRRAIDTIEALGEFKPLGITGSLWTGERKW